MQLNWKIRYLDRTDKQFKDRWLVLDTQSLEPGVRGAVELLMETGSHRTGRDVLKFRKHFTDVGAELKSTTPTRPIANHVFFLPDYFEDELGNELSLDGMGQILTGNLNTRWFPAGLPRHVVDFHLSDEKPAPVVEITLSPDEIEILRVFVREYHELMRSAFWTDGFGQLTWSGPEPTIRSAVSDEEIRSFVTIFRRLYMEKEPANFNKSVGVFTKHLGGQPIGKLVEGFYKEYEAALANTRFWPDLTKGMPTSFTAKGVIDAFIYTQFAHQPDERRQRQYEDYLKQVQGKKGLLTWRFFDALRSLVLPICNAGRLVAWWFDCYCKHHSVPEGVLGSLQADNPGIGSQEKDADRKARLRREKIEAIAEQLWRDNGYPSGGPKLFLAAAEEQLDKALGEGNGGGGA